MRRLWLGFEGAAVGVALTVLLLAPMPVRAGGFEFQAPGTRALGRGGAFTARADDPMALRYNPAALAFLPGYQLQLGSHLTFYDACVQRSGTYNDTDVLNSAAYNSRFGYPDFPADNWVNQPFPRVCRGGPPGPSPQLVFSMHPLPELGIAFGILAPAGVGTSTWGDADGTVTENGLLLPTPVRYGGIDSSLLLFSPSIGIGYSPIPELAFGATFQWGISLIDFTLFTNSGTGPQDPSQDIRTNLTGDDLFIPAVILSVHAVPIPQLDIVASARISDGIDGNATLNLTTGYYGTSMDDSLTPYTSSIRDVGIRAGQPWEFGLSVRYSDQRSIEGRYRDPDEAGRINGRVEDPMQTENFDIELDAVYMMNSQVSDFIVTPPPGSSVAICESGCRDSGTDPLTPSLQAPLPNRLPLPRGWRDQLVLRLGGDWNILPGQLALRAGTHFETSGLNSRYMGHDFIPGMRLGLHLGATFRIERFDISIAYAHIFQFDETTTDASYRHVAATGMEGVCTDAGGAPIPEYDANQPVVSRHCYPRGYGSVINAATYSAEYNVVSLSARYHFN